MIPFFNFHGKLAELDLFPEIIEIQIQVLNIFKVCGQEKFINICFIYNPSIKLLLTWKGKIFMNKNWKYLNKFFLYNFPWTSEGSEKV